MSRNTNAKTEFLIVTNGLKVLCALIETNPYYDEDDSKKYPLKVGYSEKDYEEFLNSIDFNYDSGWGSQNLFGFIWFEDGTWMERYEYDGSESWDYKKCPEIPPELLDRKLSQNIEKI